MRGLTGFFTHQISEAITEGRKKGNEKEKRKKMKEKKKEKRRRRRRSLGRADAGMCFRHHHRSQPAARYSSASTPINVPVVDVDLRNPPCC